ncbi:4'-phosphopantetheinyl transferase family protein [Streptomyces sp. NPDC101213]|uniref:4'-phosphopantetheinyl transferase family protein n=1 Tax=Streptomyces sp. NPDC101213 TaxID=3366130 RepID=UPI003820E00D
MTPAVPPASLVVSCDWGALSGPEDLLGDRERAHAALLHGPRRTEWVRTRLTAKLAVRRVSGESGGEILPDRHGAPCLVAGPASVTVSLAHTGSLAVCAVSRGDHAGALGVDVEPFDPRNEILLPRLLGHDEEPHVVGGLSPGVRATVLVSCKEAAFKACRGASRSLRDHRLWRCPDGRLWVRPAVPGAPDLRMFLSYGAGLVTALCQSGPRTPAYLRVTPGEVLAELRPGVPVR